MYLSDTTVSNGCRNITYLPDSGHHCNQVYKCRCLFVEHKKVSFPAHTGIPPSNPHRGSIWDMLMWRNTILLYLKLIKVIILTLSCYLGVLTQVAESAVKARCAKTPSIQTMAASIIGAVTPPPTEPPIETLQTTWWHHREHRWNSTKFIWDSIRYITSHALVKTELSGLIWEEFQRRGNEWQLGEMRLMDDVMKTRKSPGQTERKWTGRRNFNPRAPVSILVDALHLFLHLIFYI